MIYFKEIIDKIVKTVLITKEDSESLKAKKIVWYSAVISIFLLIFISWLIFALFTFTTENVKVPILEGDTIYTALNKLYERRLIPKAMPQYSESIDEQIVFNQNPKQGLIVKKGSVVSFNVSLGKKDNAMPDFRGYDLFELEDFLHTRFNGRLPFILESPTYEYSTEVEKGRIIRQEPKDGVPLKTVKKVKIWVSNGPKQEGALLLKNYVGNKIDQVAKELSSSSIPYTCIFNIVKEKDLDLIITEQSVGEGKLISDLVLDQKVVVFKVNKYLDKPEKGETQLSLMIDLPKKGIPYHFDVRVQKGRSKEKSILKLMTTGGVSMPIYFNADKDTKLLLYIDTKLFKTMTLDEKQ